MARWLGSRGRLGSLLPHHDKPHPIGKIVEAIPLMHDGTAIGAVEAAELLHGLLLLERRVVHVAAMGLKMDGRWGPVCHLVNMRR